MSSFRAASIVAAALVVGSCFGFSALNSSISLFVGFVRNYSLLETVGTTFPTSTPTAGNGTSSGPYLLVDSALIAFLGVMVALILLRNWRSPK